MDLYGFSYIRNGDQIGYPYLEAFSCLSELCTHTVIAVGDSTDQTRARVSSLSRTEIIDTTWSEALRKNGAIFSQQANTALSHLRNLYPSGWAIHLQADQLILKDDFDQLRKDLTRAYEEGYDAVSMRFFHFWKNGNQLAFSKRWFPQTINIIRLEGRGVSVGDSQSLGNCEKVFESDVTVFHYGHALGDQYAEVKQRALHRWWHPDAAIDSIMIKSKKNDEKEPALRYLGPHPHWIKPRLHLTYQMQEEAWIVDPHSEFDSKALAPRIYSNVTHWVSSLDQVPRSKRRNSVLINPSYLQKLLYRSAVPLGPLWKGSRPWPKEHWFLLKLSEKGIAFDLNRS